MVSVAVHCYCCLDGLEEALFIDTGEDESGFVERFGALGACADAHGGEGMSHGGEEAAFLREGSGVGDYGGGVHLQAVIVMEAEGFVLNDQRVELESAAFEAFAAAGMAAVEDGHAVAPGDGVDGVEEAQEVALGVDVFLAMGAQQDIFSFFESEAAVDVGGLDVGEVGMKHFGHWRACHVGALFGEAAIGEVSAGVLAVAEVYVGYDVDYSAVGFLGEAFVLAAVAGFHVEYGYVEAFRRYGAEARIGVAQDEEGVGADGLHELVGAVYDVAHGGSEVIADGIHVYFGVLEFQVFEKDSVKVVVVVLAGVGEDYVEVLAAFVDGGCQADYLGACADDNQQFELAVVGEIYIGIVEFHTGSKNVSGFSGLKISLQYITVTRSSVSERFMMLWV